MVGDYASSYIGANIGPSRPVSLEPQGAPRLVAERPHHVGPGAFGRTLQGFHPHMRYLSESSRIALVGWVCVWGLGGADSTGETVGVDEEVENALTFAIYGIMDGFILADPMGPAYLAAARAGVFRPS